MRSDVLGAEQQIDAKRRLPRLCCGDAQNLLQYRRVKVVNLALTPAYRQATRRLPHAEVVEHVAQLCQHNQRHVPDATHRSARQRRLTKSCHLINEIAHQPDKACKFIGDVQCGHKSFWIETFQARQNNRAECIGCKRMLDDAECVTDPVRSQACGGVYP